MNYQLQAHTQPFFRIRKVFEQDGFSIIKVEGDISTENFLEWSEKLKQVLAETPLPIVLDFSSVGFLTPRAVDLFQGLLRPHMYMFNLPSSTKNIMESAGLSQHIIA